LIVVVHCLTTTLSADEILVLERGRLVEQGPPAALLKTYGPFARLWRAQHAAAAPEFRQ
jgi:ABC-type multidrug transport system fused ATPase/permease subunit